MDCCKVVLVLTTLLCCIASKTCASEFGQFNGGFLSFTVVNGTDGLEIQMDVVSGWVLGHGPCGLNCSRASINSDTRQTRAIVMSKENYPHYFGNWTLEYNINRVLQYRDINTEVYDSGSERVIDVSERGNWEQDWMFVRIPRIPQAKEIYIRFEGMSWRNLSLQGQNIKWHLQATVTQNPRNDTGKPNNSPRAFSKPMYRIPLGQEKHIRITTMDPDGDFVKCALSKNLEALFLANNPLPNVTVTEDCIIKIPDSRSLRYQNGTFGGIAVTIRDYKENLQFSAIGLQFVVQFLEVINEPKLIYKTPDDRHRFNVYYGTTWQIDLFAEAVSPAVIDHFSYVRRHENLTFTEMKNVSVQDYKNVTMATLMWCPHESEDGEHIVCVNVEDSVGMDSSDQRCYTISVKPHYITIQLANEQTNKPYFINLPDKNSLSCDVNATCIFPVYAKTPNSRANIISIWIGKFYLESAVNDTKIAIRDNGIGKMDIRVRHVSDGSPSLCLYAMDSAGAVSNETCINPIIIPPDPCLKRPCVHGNCIRNTDDLTQFRCQCMSHFYGTFCEKEITDCPPHRCQNGVCQDLPGEKFFCKCANGWTGTLCERLVDNCKNVSCGGHGICKNDGPGKYSCDCFQRYEGGNCVIDKCSSTFRDDKTCNEPGCNSASCFQNGLCTDGGICHCSLGFEDSPNCSNSKSDLSHQQVNFVQPSPLEGSTIACFNSKPCKFSVFIAGGTDPVVRIQHVSDNLINILHVSAPEEVQYVPGIQNMYESLINIDAPPEKTYLGQQYVCLEVDNRITHLDGTSSRCYNIFYTTDLLQLDKFLRRMDGRWGGVGERKLSARLHKPIQFIEPTPKDNSRFICKVNNICHLFVYTNKDNTSSCHEVVSHSGVYVHPTIATGAHCFADVSYNFSNEALHTVCLQADENDGEKRCFIMDIIDHSNDPCFSNPCQNIGICLRKDKTAFKCICGEQYTGSNCERGPCLSSESTCLHGYCEINNRIQTCFCPLGYKGTKCNIAIPDEVNHPNNESLAFTDMFLPTEIVCVKNKPCVIPIVVSGIYSFSSKPIVDVGYVSPSIEINGFGPLEQKSSTNATYASEIMFTPTVPGKQKICLQTLSQNRINLDEICINVDVRTDALILFGDKDKPHFTPPSINMNSTVVCKTGLPCHMVFRVSSGRSNENNCSSMKVVEGLTEHYHIFSDCETCADGPSAVNNCTMDLVFNPTHMTHLRLCLEAQLKWRDVTGEVRCIDIDVVSDNYNFSGPCSRLHCMNGGFCDAENAGGVHPVCHCPIGFSGIRCESDEPPSISNNTNRPSVGNLALPVEIYCNINESCFIPFLLLGQSHNIPFVGPGHIPPAIAVENLVIDTSHSTGKEFEGYLQIRLMGNATQPVCIQSKAGNNISRVLEEICFKVQVGEGQLYGPPVDKSRPHYIDPTLPDSSTVLCKTGSECHILMYTSKTSSNCPTVSETQDYTDGLHIFLAASRNGYDCVIDISYIPPTSMQGQKKMCLQVSLPGFKGEVRCYGVISLENANLSTGLCINKECNNGGHCDSNFQEARCICRVGHGGDMCTGSSKFVEPQNVPPNMQLTESPVFTDLAFPDTLICYVGLECWLPIIINGNTSPNKPTLKFGYVDNALTAGTHMLDGGTVNGVYSGNVSFQPSTLGEYPFCIQTAISASQHISDEICCTVQVLDPSSKPTELPFQSPTLNANSAVKCQVNTTCHILFYLIPDNGQCPELIQTSVVENVFVFSPDKTENKCVIDTAFIPSSNQMGINTLCLKTRNNDNTRCIDVRVVEKINVATSSTTTEMTSSTTVTSPSTLTTSQSPATSSTQATSQPTTATTTEMTSTTITSQSTSTTSQSPATSSTQATSQPTTATSTKVTSQSVHSASQSTGTTTSASTHSTSTLTTTQSPSTSLSTQATSQSTGTTTSSTTSKSTLKTTQSPSTSLSTQATSQSTGTTTSSATSKSTLKTTQSPATSLSTQATSQSTVATSSTTTEMTSSTTVTSPSTSTTSQSPATSQSTVATSSTTTEMTSSTTVTSPSTLTTSQSPATSSTQATSQPTTATSTKVTSQSVPVHSASQSTGTTTSASTPSTSTLTTTQSPATSLSTQATLASTQATSQSTVGTSSTTTEMTSSTTVTSPSTSITSQSPATSSTQATSQPTTATTTEMTTTTITSQSTSTTSQSPATSSTQATSQPTTAASTKVTSQSVHSASQSTGTTTSASTPSMSTLTTTQSPATSLSTQAASQSTGTTTSLSTTYKSTLKTTQLPATSVSTEATSQSTSTTTSPSTTSKSTLKTTQLPATSVSTEATSQSTGTTTSPSTTSKSTLKTTQLPATSVSTEATSQSTGTTASPSTTSKSTLKTTQSPATSLLTQATLISTEAASQKIAATTGTSSKLLTTQAASTGVSTTLFATSSTTTEMTSSTTVISPSTLTTSQSPATSSTQAATSQPTTATSTKVTSQSVHSASQSTGTTTSSSTTSKSTLTTTQSPAIPLSTQATPVSTEAASQLIVATTGTSSNTVTTQAASTGVSTTTLAAGIAGGVVGVTAAAGVGTFIVKKLRKKISINNLSSPRSTSTVHPEILPE